jgi:hypothetical protein
MLCRNNRPFTPEGSLTGRNEVPLTTAFITPSFAFSARLALYRIIVSKGHDSLGHTPDDRPLKALDRL